MIVRIIMRITQIVSILFSLVVIYMLLLKLSGHSPTIEEVMMSIIGIHLAIFVGFAFATMKFTGRVSEFMTNTRREFSSLKEDISDLRTELTDFQTETRDDFTIVHDRLRNSNERLSKIEAKLC